MAAAPDSDTELLTEHFGYPPVSLIDDIINSINILAERALNSVEQGLLNAPPASLGFRPKPKSKSKSKKQQDKEADDASGADPEQAARTEVEAGTHQLETLLCASIDRNFDKFEIFVLRNFLTVRPPALRDWIRLSHYDGLDFSAQLADPNPAPDGAGGDARMQDNPAGNNDDDDDDDDSLSVASIDRLRHRLRASQQLNALLSAEHARNARALSELRRLVGEGAASTSKVKTEPTAGGGGGGDDDGNDGNAHSSATASPFAFLHAKGDLVSGGGGAAPLSTTTAFALSQTQALRALSASLQGLTPGLMPPTEAEAEAQARAHDPDASKNDGDDDDDEEGAAAAAAAAAPRSWRRQRTEYIETATRRYLEKVEGLELGRHGDVRDGDWWVGPAAIAPAASSASVAAVEGAVSLLESSAEAPQAPAPAPTTTTPGGKKRRASTASQAQRPGNPAKAKAAGRRGEDDDDDDADEGDRMDES